VKVLHGHGAGTAKENDTPLEMLMSQAGAKIVTEDKHKANMVMSPPSAVYVCSSSNSSNSSSSCCCSSSSRRSSSSNSHRVIVFPYLDSDESLVRHQFHRRSTTKKCATSLTNYQHSQPN